ncbi:hypothetical protein TCAL_00157 [Tigriopus californicus]|uniref:NADH dehydrogenase [ubiquinone] 1 alpha subcomplex subunit 5 n=1 Tax=Tigriopus californicus TaxID=6832 RepID=A0A553PG97_TIGCA|nr:NADH dehydrogenase [ubiquinone] 1 alpha subcomplex subunit 5-like [Tigriopus californicus]TRY76702.1 hypothetical protein TCAL_00157 [Tigriopus californicus]|eukprot:TCALIF_00157-PA protein Name:"Similar to C33A12.1 Probable NADH dehydrogenase [ubiquinone] 1 alpha subcomplex subunit 5 (Caenorhabditis elegans)" AED:0.04 eAED:0.04 QI:167/1/1/1/1/1/2/73/126
MATWKAAGDAAKSAIKLSTNLTKLEVNRNPHHVLGSLYTKTLRALAKMPQDYAYRKHTEAILNDRVSQLKATTDLQLLEKNINCGQIEEVVIQAQYELRLARHLLEVKSWEGLIEEAKPNQWKWPM